MGVGDRHGSLWGGMICDCNVKCREPLATNSGLVIISGEYLCSLSGETLSVEPPLRSPPETSNRFKPWKVNIAILNLFIAFFHWFVWSLPRWKWFSCCNGFLRCVTCPQSMVAISRKLRPCGSWSWTAAKDFTSCSWYLRGSLIILPIFGGIKLMLMYGSFERLPLKCVVWVGNSSWPLIYEVKYSL